MLADDAIALVVVVLEDNSFVGGRLLRSVVISDVPMLCLHLEGVLPSWLSIEPEQAVVGHELYDHCALWSKKSKTSSFGLLLLWCFVLAHLYHHHVVVVVEHVVHPVPICSCTLAAKLNICCSGEKTKQTLLICCYAR